MDEDIKVIKSVIYNQNGEKMNYIDIDNIAPYKECETFINALEHLIKAYNRKDVRYNTAYNLGKSFENNKWTSKIKEIIDKAEVMDYYTLPDVIDDLNKLLEGK